MQTRLLFSAIIACALIGFSAPANSQTFTLAANQVDISVAPSFNHMPVRVSVITNAPGINVSNIVLSSDSAWVSPSMDAARSQVVLTFVTSNLVSQLYTATIKASSGNTTNTLFVRANVAPLNIFKLKDDPRRSRTYGVQQNGLGIGSVVVLDPITTNYIGNVTVGRKPSDLALSDDGLEMFVINCVDETISVIDLSTLAVKETLTLPAFDNWGQSDTTANIGVGPGNILYYTDGSWAPVLRVLNRTTMQVLQTVYIETNSGNGFGDFAVTSDKSVLFGWAQYGWTAGWAGSYISRFTITGNGVLTFVESTDSTYPTVISRDPIETPVLITSDNAKVFIKQFAVNAGSVRTAENAFPSPVYSITPGGEVASTDTAVYETESGIKLADLPRSAPIQAISSDYARLIYFDSAARTIKLLNLLDLIGPGILNREVVPVTGSIALSPPRLEWNPLPGIDLYRVYLGLSESAVANAGTNSLLFLGAVTQPFVPLETLTPGTKYFWRVDAVSPFDVTKGDVNEFTVSLISSSTNEINVATVRGHADFRTSFNLNSDIPGIAWEASADQSWLTFAQTNGSTPGTVEVILNASQLSVGLHQASVTISSGTNTLFSIPVKLRVEPLNLTIMKSDSGSVFVYAISEDSSTTPTRAYLLEINTLTESINRVVKVGSSVTDLAIHKGDHRIYVPNWLTGSLLAIDLDTFQQVRAYAFSPFGGMGYSENDIYRVSAGVAGRLVWEEEDQWIDINIFDTVAGTNIASAFVRQGGGGFDATARFYYHGDDNSSGAEIHKFDVTGDRFTELAQVRVANASYYGSRTVTVSENGNRIFWNGAVFDPDLHLEWAIGEHIYTASADGHYAFGESKIFDVDQRSVLTTSTPATTVKAFNSIAAKLVFKQANTIGFLKLDSQEHVSPADGVIISSPLALEWQSLPVEASFQFYLGQSQSEISAATTNSPLFLGETTSTNFALGSLLPAGIYFWRVDAVTQYGTVTGRVHSFIVSSITPDIQEVSAATFQGRPVTATINLASEVAGESWQATANVSWISFSQTNGTTPATIQVTLNASVVPPAVRSGSITISGVGGNLFSIPVQLTVETLHLTVVKSDPASHKVYAVSEDTAQTPTRAFLLEINTLTESIERVIDVGSSVTDLAVHNGDNRIYVPNWVTGSLLAIDKSTFQQVRSYPFAPFGGTGYGDGDVYRIAVGAAGRLVVEEQDQWIDISIFDTGTGTTLANTSVREGGGAFGGEGRYYYHGDNNSSGAEIHKFDVTGDVFTELAQIRVESVSYYGSRTVVVSEDGSRVFWNGSVFDEDLVEEWTIGDEIFSTSPNGHYAFSFTKIYDVDQKRAVLGMPVDTRVSAFNSSSEKLVVQVGNSVGFFKITTPLSIPSPVLSVEFTNHDFVVLTWTDQSLEESFTLQSRLLGATNWTDIAAPARNVTEYTAIDLSQQTTYEFRIKADAGNASSDWSGIVTVTTPAVPPSIPTLNIPIATTNSVTLSWSNPDGETAFILERGIGSSDFSLLAVLSADTTTYTDTNVILSTTYSYRVQATNAVGESGYSEVRTVTVQPPVPPSGRSFPVPSGLVGWWRGEGNANDSVGANHGLLFDATFTSGKVAQAFSFDGSSSTMLINPASPVTSNTVTLEAWVYPTGRQGQFQEIVSQAPYGFSINYDTFEANLTILATTFDDFGDPYQYSYTYSMPAGTPIEYGSWYHLALTYDGMNFSFYVNGVLQSSAYLYWPLNYSSPAIRVGGNYYYDDFGDINRRFEGFVDELSIYNRALTPEEISGIYSADSNGKTSGSYIFWHNHRSGQLAYWETRNASVEATGFLREGRVTPRNWKVVGMADFNGDNDSDFLWQNEKRALAIWQMKGKSFENSYVLRGGRGANPGWQVTGAADFDRDGKADILWRNEDGRVAVWYMNGLDYFSSALLNNGNPVNSLWQIVGTTDFDHDGQVDLLWQHDDGFLFVTLLDQTTFKSSFYLNNYKPVHPSWRFVGLGDFNSDSKADFLWQNRDGRTAIWFMNGNIRTGSAMLRDGRAVAPEWQIVGSK